MRKGSIHQEDVAILILHTPNNRATKYVKQKLIEIKAKIDKFIIIIVNSNTPLSTTDRKNRQKISKDIELNTINQKNLTFTEHSIQQQKAHILFKCPQNIYQDRPYPRPENKSQHI